MKLTKQECQNLVDSRLLDLERYVGEYKDNEPTNTDNNNLGKIKDIITGAERLLEAYESKVEAEEEEAGEELEKEYRIDMTAGLDETLNIRKEK